ncbi:MAG: hypothetical protein NVS4B9_34590 [Ktedonobacteraceae bacterium]
MIELGTFAPEEDQEAGLRIGSESAYARKLGREAISEFPPSTIKHSLPWFVQYCLILSGSR